MTPPKRLVTAQVTEAQWSLLELLGRCHAEDVAAEVGPRSAWKGDHALASRQVARGLVGHGMARYSEPHNTYLLLTDRGKAFLAGTVPLSA